MINLNKPSLTEKSLFKILTEYDVFDYYIKDFEIHTVFTSPLRKDDNPSFTVFKSDEHNKLFYKDFGTGDSGDCIAFVRKLLGLTYGQALQEIVRAYNLQDEFIDNIPVVHGVKYYPSKRPTGRPISYATADIKTKKRSKLQIQPRTYRQYDFDFWNEFGIEANTLRKYWVQPLEYFFVNGKVITPHKYAYAYIEIKDGDLTYKIYQPFLKDRKWISNHPKGVHQGYIQLPSTGDLLIITKSLKDVMSLYDVLNISAVGIQNEKIVVKDTVMDEYFKRFNKVLGFFDNDSTGKELSEVYTEKYGIRCILSPFEKSKDFSAMIKNEGINTSTETILKLINDD